MSEMTWYIHVKYSSGFGQVYRSKYGFASADVVERQQPVYSFVELRNEADEVYFYISSDESSYTTHSQTYINMALDVCFKIWKLNKKSY